MQLFVFEDNDDYFLVAANEFGHAIYLIEQEHGTETRNGVELIGEYTIATLHTPVIRLSRIG